MARTAQTSSEHLHLCNWDSGLRSIAVWKSQLQFIMPLVQSATITQGLILSIHFFPCVYLFFCLDFFFFFFEGVLSVLRGGERVYFFPVRLMGQVFPLAGLLNLIYYYLITSSCLISLSLLPSLPPMISACMFFLSVYLCLSVLKSNYLPVSMSVYGYLIISTRISPSHCH